VNRGIGFTLDLIRLGLTHYIHLYSGAAVNTLRISKNKLDQPFKITKGEEWEFIIVEPLQLAVRFDIDPHKDSSRDDKFILSSTDGSINIVKTIINDTIPDDNYTDILYEDLDESKNYTLKVDTGEESYLVFENIPGTELFTIKDSVNASSEEHSDTNDEECPEDFSVDEDQIEWIESDPDSLTLSVRFNIDPHEASSHDDKFILSSTDGAIKIVKTIANDKTPDDKFVDIDFENLDESKNYTLKVDTGEDSYLVFENVPASELFHIGKKSTSNNDDDFEDWDHEGLEDHDHEFEDIDI
jgi:hypothetical protein